MVTAWSVFSEGCWLNWLISNTLLQ